MARYLERLREIVLRYPDRTAVVDAERSLTYNEFDIESGKIYNYLKKQGVKREDCVMILVKRGIGGVSCIHGILKAGAAFIPLEEDYPKERIDFIKKDSSCKIVIDEELYRKIIRTEEYREGYEETDPHDTAFVVYTSGSTGTPKGAIHEYGNIEQEASLIQEKTTWREFREGIISPFYFMATFHFMIRYTLQAFTIYIVPSDLVRDFVKFSRYLYENRIQGIFLSPSYLRLYKDPSPYLEEIVTAGEPANDIYYPGGKPAIRNTYGMTETAFTILETFLDKAYEIAPMGKPVLPEIDLHLEDEDGNRIEGAGSGEICFKCEYFRGYLNLPEKTKAAVVNGFFHSGDMGRRDENGVYYIIGRKDDMFKINGNRVEPVEIERAVKKITGLNTVVAKGFDIDGRSFICLYYLRNEAQELNLTEGDSLKIDVSALSDILPQYMLPTYYIPLDKMPLNERGKTVRRLLAPPEIKTWEKDYVPPANDTEKAFCEMMAEILDTDKIGAESDFYLSGGDSLRSIRLIALAGERGYSFTAKELYETRTPRKLAKIARSEDINLEEKNKIAQEKDMPLLQLQSLWQDKLTDGLNAPVARIAFLLKLKDGADMEKFRRAVDSVYRHHPILLTKLARNSAGKYIQHYSPDLFSPTTVTEIGYGEMRKRIENRYYVFDMERGILHRRTIFKTENGTYFYALFHHVLTDGTGIRLITDNIYRAYAGEALPPDYYYYILSQEFDENPQPVPEEYEETFGTKGADGTLKPDLSGPDAAPHVLTETFSRQSPDENTCHLIAAALATAKHNDAEGALIYWAYSGRDDYLKNNSAGGFVKYLPFYLAATPQDTPATLKVKAKEQTSYTLSHNRTFQNGLLKQTPLTQTLIYLYQKDIWEKSPP